MSNRDLIKASFERPPAGLLMTGMLMGFYA